VADPKTKSKHRLHPTQKLDTIQKFGFDRTGEDGPTVNRSHRSLFGYAGLKSEREEKQLKRIAEILGKALGRSHRTGQKAGFHIEIDPRGEFKITRDGKSASRDLEPKRDLDLENALTAARERGRNRVAEILRGNDMLNADAFAALLGTSRVTVSAKRRTRQVLGLEGAKRGFRFPKWQLGQNGKPFSALPELFDRLGDDAWAVYRFLVQRHPELDGLTGREALHQGKAKQALEAAESVARGSA
jgi:hypothetical protein